jgi:hypothetical protein
MAKFKALTEADQGLAGLTGVRKRRYLITVMLLMCLLAIIFIDSERVEAQPTVGGSEIGCKNSGEQP